MQLLCNFLDLLEQSNTHPNLAYQLLQAQHPLKSASERYFSLILPTFSLTIELANQPLPFLTIGGHNRHCRVYCWNVIAVSKTLLPIVSWLHESLCMLWESTLLRSYHVPLFDQHMLQIVLSFAKRSPGLALRTTVVKRAPSGRDPRLCGKVIQSTTIFF